jgi:hypothetical protein
MSVSFDRQNNLDADGDEYPVDDTDTDDASPLTSPRAPTGRRPPPLRVSFSHSVRPSRSKLGADITPLGTPHLGSGGVPLGERVHSIPESTARMSVAIPTGLSQPEATPLPLVPMIVLGIVS